MSADLAGYTDGVPERYVPELMRGELIEAEHLGRYLWASSLVWKRRVLDAGCGVGYGSRLLADAGASEVVAVDNAIDALVAARATLNGAVQLLEADVRRLPFEDASFDVVVCFEVVEHVDEPGEVLAELARVVDSQGLLVVSTPNRLRSAERNPHHLHELSPEELRATLEEHFAYVQLYAQDDWVASVILSETDQELDGLAPLEGIDVRKAIRKERGDETYAIAVASHLPVNEPSPVAVLTHAVEARTWVEHFERQQASYEALASAHADQAAALERVQGYADEIGRELEAALADRSRALQTIEELRQASQTLAQEVDDLRYTLDETEEELQRREREVDFATDRVLEAETLLGALPRIRAEAEAALLRAAKAEGDRAAAYGSWSWRLTRPLRSLRTRVRRG